MNSSLNAGPVGLRDRQKLERERRIVKAAEKLFARKGYGDVAMEDVAARAGLAVGTIYNYFPSKSALLLAIVRRETESLLARGRKILDDPPRDAVAAACAFTEIFLDDFTRDDRRLWRELFGAAIADPSVVGGRLFEGDARWFRNSQRCSSSIAATAFSHPTWNPCPRRRSSTASASPG